MAKNKEHQHVVPKAYLRGFANADEEVSVRRRGEKQTKLLHINNVAVRSGFYNFVDLAGQQTDTLENWFDTDIESPAAPVLKSLRAASGPFRGGTADLVSLTRFVAAQLLRTPTVAAYMGDIDDHIRPIAYTMELLKQAGLSAADLTEAELDDWRQSGQRMADEHATSGDRESRLRTIMRKFVEFADELSARQWATLVSDDPLLITGDAPVATLNPTGVGWQGLLPPGAPVLMPLTPTRLLVGEEVALSGDVVLTPELARAVNDQIALNVDDALIKEPSAAWPSYLDLRPSRPRLPAPRITMTKSDAAPTPLVYPVTDPAVGQLLRKLGA